MGFKFLVSRAPLCTGPCAGGTSHQGSMYNLSLEQESSSSTFSVVLCRKCLLDLKNWMDKVLQVG